jgi:hypothetical protein
MYKRTILWLIVLVAAAGLTTSCLLDPEKTKEEPEDKTPVVFKDLTEKDDVLHNLELSYNERRFDKYEELLDADFITTTRTELPNSGDVSKRLAQTPDS